MGMHTSTDTSAHATSTTPFARDLTTNGELSLHAPAGHASSLLKWRGALAQALTGTLQQRTLHTVPALGAAERPSLPSYLQQVSVGQPLATQAVHLARLHQLSVALSTSMADFHWCNCAHKQPLSWRNNGAEIDTQVLANGLHLAPTQTAHVELDETQLIIDLYTQDTSNTTKTTN